MEHAVQRKQKTCWDLAFCKQNNEKHNHKVQQQKKDNLYRIQLPQFYKLASFTITLSRAAELWGKRLKIIFSLRHRRLSSSGRCCLVRTKKNILIFLAKLKTSKQRLTHFHNSPHPCFYSWKFTRIVTMDELKISGCHHRPIFGFNLDRLPRKLSWNERVAL